MTFTQLDDTMLDGPEMLSVSRSARLLLLEGYQYGNRHLTDGAITESQWRRSTDTEDFLDELDQLADAGLIEQTASGWQLPWDKQQSRDAVMKGRERRRQDNERRAQALNLHRAGDHSLCTHEGGGRHRNYLTQDTDGRSTGRSGGRRDGRSGAAADADNGTNSGRSDGRSTGRSGGRSDGHAPGGENGRSTGRSDGHAPAQPSPAQPSRSGTEDGGDGVARRAVPAKDSAGAPSTASTARPVFGGDVPGRYVGQVWMTADQTGGVDPNTMTDDEADAAWNDWINSATDAELDRWDSRGPVRQAS